MAIRPWCRLVAVDEATANDRARYGTSNSRFGAAFNATSINYSTVVGENACASNTTITNSICIGTSLASPSGVLSSKLWIGISATPILYGDMAAGQLGVNTLTLTPNAALTVGGTVAATSVITTPSTVAGLPASPVAGQQGFVTDATAGSCVFLTAVVGGSTVKCPVVYNGTAWVAG